MSAWIDTAFMAADAVFWRLLWVSVQGAGVTALVWALCRYLPALSAASRCWLWWVVCAQLLIGLLWPEAWRQNLPPALSTAFTASSESWQTLRSSLPAEPAPVWIPAESAGPEVINAHNAALPRQAALASRLDALRQVRWTSWLGFLWLSIVLFALTRLLAEYRQLSRLLATSMPAPQALHDCLQEAAAALGMSQAPRLRLSPSISSPMLCGAWTPCIVLPAPALLQLDATQIRLALRHELLHLRRGDLLLGWVPALAQRLFCFNPLAALAAGEYELTREAAVDAALMRTDAGRAPDYGQLLLTLGVNPSPGPALATASPTFKALHRRLSMLAHTHTPSRSSTLITGAALLLAVGCSAPLATAEPTTRQDSTLINFSSDAGTEGAYVYSDGEHLLSYGTQIHLKQGKDGSISFGQGKHNRISIDAAMAGGKARLWYAADGRMYLLEDSATLAQVDQLLQPMRELGKQQGALGEQQGALGERQGALGAQQGTLGAQQGELGLKVSQLAMRRAGAQSLSDAEEKELDRQLDALDEQMEALAQKQEALGEQQEVLGQQQEALGARQEALGEQQQEAGEQAQREIASLMQQAIADGRAKLVESASLR